MNKMCSNSIAKNTYKANNIIKINFIKTAYW